ncbi:hypothetical protein WA026_007732 [Henosepilachna vigintioctopunctata]|uniref:WD repeat-containing protein 74 n=1 Tax=Henosepilachna vigintioctopunctata TaxID=420089 RepID=A0AAW1TUW1_9CUCU
MDLTNRFNFFIGSVRGTLIGTNLDPKSKIHYEVAAEAEEISSMIWGRKDNEIIAGFRNGNIYIYDINQQKYCSTFSDLKSRGAIVGLACIDNRILAASHNGMISIRDSVKENDSITTFKSNNSTLDSFAQSMNTSNIIATGGEMNDLKLWDVETKQCTFKAKSLGHDQLNLPIKASIRGITFIPEEQIVCCATKEGHVLLYDDRAQKKPVCKFFDGKSSFLTIAPTYRQRNVLAGTTTGYIQNIDMKAGKNLKNFTNIGGSVTCILCDPIEPIISTISLDRYLRIFNLDTKEMIHKQYLKHSLTKMVMKPIIKEESQEPENVEFIDEEYEEIFNNLEEISEKSSRKRNPAHFAKYKSKKIKK